MADYLIPYGAQVIGNEVYFPTGGYSNAPATSSPINISFDLSLEGLTQAANQIAATAGQVITPLNDVAAGAKSIGETASTVNEIINDAIGVDWGGVLIAGIGVVVLLVGLFQSSSGKGGKA